MKNKFLAFIIVAIQLITFAPTTNAQLGELLNTVADGIKKDLQNNLEREITNIVLKDIRVHNPFVGYETSIDNFANDILTSAGFTVTNEPLRVKLNTIINYNLLFNVKFIKYSNEWVSLQDLGEYTGFNYLFNYYYEARNSYKDRNDIKFASSIILLMDSISRLNY